MPGSLVFAVSVCALAAPVTKTKSAVIAILAFMTRSSCALSCSVVRAVPLRQSRQSYVRTIWSCARAFSPLVARSGAFVCRRLFKLPLRKSLGGAGEAFGQFALFIDAIDDAEGPSLFGGHEVIAVESLLHAIIRLSRML